jgi:hypothetical protein
LLGLGGQLLGRAGLADARLARQHHQPASAGQGVVQRACQLGNLATAAHEVRAQAEVRGSSRWSTTIGWGQLGGA